MNDGPLSPEELDRYARHIVLREVGGPGQKRLRAARIAVIGAGGLGCPALQYLAAAGIGRIRLIDDDVVSLSNLQRQVLFGADDVGALKVEAAAARLSRLNPHCDIEPVARRFADDNAAALLADADLLIDGSDSFATRRLANRAALKAEIPLVFGAVGQWEGQVSLFEPTRGSPCYHCLFPSDPADGLAPSCAEAGILGALTGVVGATMATEAVKHLARAGETLAGRLWLYDALHAETRVIRLKKRPDCAVCGAPRD